MPSWKDAFPSKYIGTEDVATKDFTLTIAHADVEDVGDDRKLVLYFQDAKKAMVLNKGNAQLVAELVGDGDYSHWGGHQITIGWHWTQYQGKRTKGLVVRDRVPQNGGQQRAPQHQQAAQAPMDDEIPF